MTAYLLNSKWWRLSVVSQGLFSATPQTLNSVRCGILHKHTLTEDEMLLDERELEATEIIKNFTEEETKRLESLQKGYWRLIARRASKMPEQMTNVNWLHMMSVNPESGVQRRKWYKKLWEKNQRSEMKKNMKKCLQEKENITIKHETQAESENLENPNIIHRRIAIQRSVDQARKWKGMQALMFGSPLVFDFACREHPYKQLKYIRNLLERCAIMNMDHQEPFHFHCTGLLEKGKLLEFRCIKGLTVHKQDILEIFPPERLVYVTPHTENMLQYNSDDIYVLGVPYRCYFEPSRHVLRIRELGIRSACLPVHHYIRRRMDSEDKIKLHTIVKTLLDYNFTRDWDKALMNVDQALSERDKFIRDELSKHAARSDTK